MESNFDVNDIVVLKFKEAANRGSRIEMDASEGWLYVSTDTTDDMNRIINYSYTFPLDRWMLDDIRRIAKDGEVPYWETGECQYRSSVNYGLFWNLLITTPDEEFRYSGADSFPRGYDTFSRELHALMVSLFDSFKMDLDDLNDVYLCTDSRMNKDSFSLRDHSLHATINGRSEYLNTVPEHLDAIRTILKDYPLQPYAPKELRPMESEETVILVLRDRYENSLSLWWGKERPAWADDMIQRLYDAMKVAYRDIRTIVNPIDPDKYCLSEGTKRIIIDHLGTIGKKLPIEQDELIDSWDYIIDRKEHLLRRLSIGGQADMEEIERMVCAAEEMEQFRCGNLNYEKINEILSSKDD